MKPPCTSLACFDAGPFHQILVNQTPFRQLRNPWPPLELIGPEQVEQLHEAAMNILENIGLEFLDDEALDIW
ncbi:MAG TPA: trimethylamine methyltransferase family protein, partial [Anaerolineae bacterium]